MNVDRGSVTPNVVCIRFWTERTEDRDIGTAISVSVISGSGAANGWALEAEGGGASFGGAGFALLRSRCPSLVIRADCSEEYEEDILPKYARTSPFSNRPFGPLAGILSASEAGTPFSWRSWTMDG